MYVPIIRDIDTALRIYYSYTELDTKLIKELFPDIKAGTMSKLRGKAAEQFSAAGIEAAHIDGRMKKEERARIVEQFRCGALDILCNAQDQQVQGYNFKQLMQLAKSAGLPDGKAYETVEELCRDLAGRMLRVSVTHNTYNGRTSEKIDQLRGVKPTQFPECRHVMKEKAAPLPSDAPAQKPADTFVSSAAPALGNLDDFEEILSDGEVPF